MKFKDYYKILGIEPAAGKDEIRRAYRKLARKYHPDVSKEKDAEERFKELGEAYEALKDPEKRKAYDQVRQGGWRQGDDFRPPPGWQHAAGGDSGFRPEDLGGFSDFFSSLFGDARGGGRSRRGPVRSAGRDSNARIEVDLETAFQGGTRRVSLARAETAPDGSMVQRPQDLDIRIPAGVTDGQQIRLRGQGEPGFNGGPSGDLYLEIGIKPHSMYELQGRDLHLTLPVAPWEAALGGKITVPTPGGKISLTIPPGSSTGKRFRLKGRGMPGKTPGDQFVILKVVVPPVTSERERELYQKLQQEQAFNPRAGMEGGL